MLSKVQEDSLYAGNSGEVTGNRDITENRFDDFGDEGDDLSSSDDDSYENRDFVQLNQDTSAIAQGFHREPSDLRMQSNLSPKSTEVFLNHLRAHKRMGSMSRDQIRQLKEEAKQLDCIKSDRYRCANPDADLLSERVWEAH